jgi:hypothetical protein
MTLMEIFCPPQSSGSPNNACNGQAYGRSLSNLWSCLPLKRAVGRMNALLPWLLLIGPSVPQLLRLPASLGLGSRRRHRTPLHSQGVLNFLSVRRRPYDNVVSTNTRGTTHA